MRLAARIRVVWISALVGQGAIVATRETVASTGSTAARPAECGPSRNQPTLGFWDRVATSVDPEFCTVLARGHALLRDDPEQTVQVAAGAERRWPGRGAVRLLLARSLASAGELATACRLLDQGGYLRSGVRLPPIETALQARCAWRLGDMSTAWEAYRRFHVTSGDLDDRALITSALLETALVGMVLGPDSLIDAEGYAAGAMEADLEPGRIGIADGILALALSRQGRQDEALGVAAGSVGPWQLWELLERHVEKIGIAAEPDELLGLGNGSVSETRASPREVANSEAALTHYVAESDGFPLMAPVSELMAVAATLALAHDARLADRLWREYASLEGLGVPLKDHAERMILAFAAGDVERRR